MIVVYLIFLAVIQAVTEFLPVSSLGHLCILEQYMGIGHETGLLSETMLHLEIEEKEIYCLSIRFLCI